MDFQFKKWKSCSMEKPKKNGTYIVLSFCNGKFSSAQSFEFSCKYGWNANRNCPQTAIPFRDGYGWEYVWSEVVTNEVHSDS